MTETQAKSSAPAGATGSPEGQTAPGGGRPVVGRAHVGDGGGAGNATFVRPPGMVPPPDRIEPPRPAGAAKSQVAEAVRAARATVSAAATRGPRRARLYLRRIDPWSVMKLSFVVSFVLLLVTVVATSVLYLALDAMGVFDSVNKTLASLVGSAGDAKSFNLQITAKGVIGVAAVLGIVNMVLFTALATLGSFVYNVCADLVGGLEVTLSERE